MEMVSGDNRRLLLTRAKLTVKSSSPTNLFITGRKGAPMVFHWRQGSKTEWLKPESWGGVLGKGHGEATPPLRGLGSAVSSARASGVRGVAKTAQRFSTIFSTQNGVS